MAELCEPDTEELLRRAEEGDEAAVDRLLSRHRRRLRQVIAVRMDPRLARRLDPSDVVQDTLIIAHGRLPKYLHTRPLPFFAWLRMIAWNQLIDLQRRHIRSRRRTVDREEHWGFTVSGESAAQLADRLIARGNSPSAQFIKEELRDRVQQALKLLPELQREMIVMRHLEELHIAEIAALLEIPEGTVKSRHFRALEQLRRLLESPVEDESG